MLRNLWCELWVHPGRFSRLREVVEFVCVCVCVCVCVSVCVCVCVYVCVCLVFLCVPDFLQIGTLRAGLICSKPKARGQPNNSACINNETCGAVLMQKSSRCFRHQPERELLHDCVSLMMRLFSRVPVVRPSCRRREGGTGRAGGGTCQPR